MSSCPGAWRAGDDEHPWGGHLATEVAFGTLLHVAGKFLENEFAPRIEQTLLLQLLDFSADSLHTSGDHLTIELVHLALVFQVNSFDCELFSRRPGGIMGANPTEAGRSRVRAESDCG